MDNWFTLAKTFVSETRSELKKVTFPSRDEVVGTTIVVVVTSFIFAAFLGASDGVIQFLYRTLINAVSG